MDFLGELSHNKRPLDRYFFLNVLENNSFIRVSRLKICQFRDRSPIVQVSQYFLIVNNAKHVGQTWPNIFSTDFENF
jgi:hypothetical protein